MRVRKYSGQCLWAIQTGKEGMWRQGIKQSPNYLFC